MLEAIYYQVINFASNPLHFVADLDGEVRALIPGTKNYEVTTAEIAFIVLGSFTRDSLRHHRTQEVRFVE